MPDARESARGAYPSFHALDLDGDIRKRRRRLPHWTQEECAYFITIHLADSLPQDLLRAWRQERAAWLAVHSEPWTLLEEQAYTELFENRIDRWLDRGLGSCLLAQPAVTSLVANALHFFDGKRYALDEYSILSTHMHVVLQPFTTHPLSNIMHSQKSYTAHEMNRLLDLQGHRWHEESFDHAIRSWEQLDYYRHYIRENPIQAHSAPGTFIVGRGSGIHLEGEDDEG
jgi:hypothetical protein